MKAGMNGVLNVSIPDGWVPEGIVSGQNGWLFGKGEPYTAEQDRAELYQLLESQILPIYFDRESASKEACPLFSRRWVALMKNSIESITEQFNTDRMLAEYVEKMYLPAALHSAPARPAVAAPAS